MHSLTRRSILKIAAASLASPLLRNAAAATLPLPALPLLPVDRPEPGIVEAHLVAAWGEVAIAGRTARLQTYNGSFPGPVLRLREGDQVRLRFTNLLDEPTNLHLHGLHMSPAVDDPFRELDPGETALLEFAIPYGTAGTFWYHPHIHGSVAEQLFAGLAGPIIIGGPDRYVSALRRAESHLVVLKDLSLAGDSPAPHSMFDWMNGKEGDLVLVNGALQPTLSPARGPLRLRLLNASNARYYRLHVEEHPLHLIATDGGLLESPVVLDELLLAPGERAEVLVPLQGTGDFRLLDLPYDRGSGGMHGGHHGGGSASAATIPLLTISVPRELPQARIPERILHEPIENLRAATPARRFDLGGHGMGWQFTINGQSFDESRVDVRATPGSTEVWEIRNLTAMDHPFHLHIYPFQVVSRGGAPEPYSSWKDVVNVRAGEVVRIAVPFRDFRGKTVFHCHIVEHEDLGMMGVLEV